jgi:hypothetical protein
VTSPARITRRRLLAGACAAAVPVALAPLRPWRAIVEVAAPPPSAERLARLLAARDSARRLGRRAAAALPAARAPEHAAAVLASLAGGSRRAARLDDDGMRRLVAERVRADFAKEDTVQVCGWVLSRTEARLCAVAALDDGDARR